MLKRLAAVMRESTVVPVPPGSAGGRVTDRLSAAHGGTTLGRGIYQILDSVLGVEVSASLRDMDVKHLPRGVHAFAADWRGVLYVADPSGLVFVADVDPARALCVAGTIADFHNVVLARDWRQLLDAGGFGQWQAEAHAPGLDYARCAGWTKPLFLGGEATLANRQAQALSSYVESTAQLWNQVKNLPAGTKVESTFLRRGDRKA